MVWKWVWEAALVAAMAGFVWITIVVGIRGFGEMRSLLAQLIASENDRDAND